ncbi:hypothetical protein FN846DRAFT_1021955 [Sphaerosporella brunnea]|uniref:Uncharacterized protein n=1 Tax=Sphaerosporella brunnea TaxID=1250544 RepID=A0A5J5EVU9_9PEZI|nr:hypothetical protein FN846DRAFT_1021955 [Sphaerosporella brunnea]
MPADRRKNISQTPNARIKRNRPRESLVYKKSALRSKFANRFTRWLKTHFDATEEERAAKKAAIENLYNLELEKLVAWSAENQQEAEPDPDPEETFRVNGWSGVLAPPPPRDENGRFLAMNGQFTKEARMARWAAQAALGEEQDSGREEPEAQEAHTALLDSSGASNAALDIERPPAVNVGKAMMVDASTSTEDLPVCCEGCWSSISGTREVVIEIESSPEPESQSETQESSLSDPPGALGLKLYAPSRSKNIVRRFMHYARFMEDSGGQNFQGVVPAIQQKHHGTMDNREAQEVEEDDWLLEVLESDD